MKMYDKEDHRKAFNNIVTRELTNINRFLDDLLNLSRPLQLTPIPLDVRSEISTITEMFSEETAKKGINVEKIFSEDAIKLKADKFAMERVFKNIMRNAIDALPDGGSIRVSIASSADYVDIEFRDTGSGIPPERLENLFTEFTTTKGTGLGLGLAISKKIINAHQGAIKIGSEVGKGTAVTIRLPTGSHFNMP